MASATTHRKLSTFDATMLVMGGIIGIGIFFTPAKIAAACSSEGAYLGLWALGGLAALSGAMTFAELSAAFPRVGGWYVWLREAFGRRTAFLFAWTVLLVVSTGACALVARFLAVQVVSLLFEPYAGERTDPREIAIAAGVVVAVTGLAMAGLKSSALFQNLCMVAKLGAVGTFVLFGLALWSGGEPAAEAAASHTTDVGWLEASLGVLFTYGGWQLLSYIAPAVENPQRTLPRAIVFGVSGVLVLYLAVNLGYLRVLGLEGLAQTRDSRVPVAIAMATELFGDGAGTRFALSAMAVSALGFLVATLITTPGIYVAMAREGLFLPAFGRTSPRTGAPLLALAAQCALVLAYLAWSAADRAFVESLTDAVVFAEWIFHGLAGAALLTLTRRGGTERPFRSPLFPLFPVVYTLLALAVVCGNLWVNLRSERPEITLIGIVAVGLGLLAYEAFARAATSRMAR